MNKWSPRYWPLIVFRHAQKQLTTSGPGQYACAQERARAQACGLGARQRLCSHLLLLLRSTVVVLMKARANRGPPPLQQQGPTATGAGWSYLPVQKFLYLLIIYIIYYWRR